jgi:hypothetical protein
MVELNIKVYDEGARQYLDDLKREIPSFIDVGLRGAADYIRGQVQLKYLRGPRPERLRVASGRLSKSIQSDVVDHVGVVGSDAESDEGFNYPGYWEYDGSRHGGPRPFLNPAVEEQWDGAMQRFEDAMGKALDKWLSAKRS